MHSFPNPEKDPVRFRSWLYAIGGDILAMDNENIYKKGRVCHKHFETKYHTWTKTLSPNAVPTLHLPGKTINIIIRCSFIFLLDSDSKVMVVFHTYLGMYVLSMYVRYFILLNQPNGWIDFIQ